jgi:hypothetical protein
LLRLSIPRSARTCSAQPAVTLMLLFMCTQAWRSSRTLLHVKAPLALKGTARASRHPRI